MGNWTTTDRIISKIKNHPVSSVIIVFAIILGGIAFALTSIDQIWTFVEKRLSSAISTTKEEANLAAPELGKNPFETAKEYAEQRFIPGSEKYVSPAPKGKVTFDYSNNNGKYSIGSGAYVFETKWSKASDQSIHVYSDPTSILTVALVKDKQEISSIDDARIYDGSSRIRTPNIGQIVLLQNTNGLFAALKILDIKDDTRGSQFDELTFEYVIQTNGTPDFTEFS